MATLEELQTTITGVLQDNVFSADRTIALINQGIRFCALNVLLPELESSGVVDTVPDINNVVIPAAWSFDRNLYHCSSTDEVEIKVLDSFNRLLEAYPNMQNEQLDAPVERVLVLRSSLVYYPRPATATELTCSFYRKPTPLVNDADVPTCLPEGAHEELLENYVLWKCYGELEDGFEGKKINTEYYQNLFNIALDNLDMLIDHGQSRSRPVVANGWI